MTVHVVIYSQTVVTCWCLGPQLTATPNMRCCHRDKRDMLAELPKSEPQCKALSCSKHYSSIHSLGNWQDWGRLGRLINQLSEDIVRHRPRLRDQLVTWQRDPLSNNNHQTWGSRNWFAIKIASLFSEHFLACSSPPGGHGRQQAIIFDVQMSVGSADT